MILKNCTFFNEEFEKEFGDIEIENGRIKSLGILAEDGRDMDGSLIVPGFVDIHIHGCAGGDASDGTAEALDKMSAELARHGVTSFCPTTMTLPHEKLLEAVKCIAEYKSGTAKIAGINLEGPYISKEKCGAQNSAYIRAGSIDELEELLGASGNTVKLITVAPEAFDSGEFIRYASERLTVAVGHSAADEAQCRKAISQGVSHATHLYNAMSPMSHRDAGVAGTALDSSITCELICDGAHVCPSVLRNTFKTLGEDRAVAVSDSMRAAGLGAGEYELGGQTAFVREDDCVARLADGTIAASITNLHRELRNLVDFGVDFKAALRACTINPARVIGADAEIGSIAVGKCADLVVLDEELEIKEVYIDGTLA
jgi:N-acetylglucosamine-6-phosphate deacetylase